MHLDKNGSVLFGANDEYTLQEESLRLRIENIKKNKDSYYGTIEVYEKALKESEDALLFLQNNNKNK